MFTRAEDGGGGGLYLEDGFGGEEMEAVKEALARAGADEVYISVGVGRFFSFVIIDNLMLVVQQFNGSNLVLLYMCYTF